MIELLALKIIGAVAGVAALGATALTLIPPPVPSYGVWMDAPADGATIEEGPVTIILHSDLDNLLGIQAVLVSDGVTVATLTDNALEKTSRGADASTLSLFAQDWNATPGVYEVQLKSCVQDGPCWQTQRAASLIVVEEGGVFVDTAQGTTAPTPTATPTPTSTPTPTPTPSTPAPPPAPEPTVAPPVYEMPYGFIRQTFTDATKLSSYFTIRGAIPQAAVGSVQVQVVPEGQSPSESGWASIPCTGPLTPDPEFTDKFSCSTAEYVLEPGGGPARTGYYRVVLTNGDKTYVGSVQYWSMIR